MIFSVLIIGLFVFSLGAMELQEGDILIAQIFDGTDTASVAPYENYGLVCQNNQLIWDDSIYAFEVKDSLLILWPYSGKPRLMNGQLDRRNLSAVIRNNLKQESKNKDISVKWKSYGPAKEQPFNRHWGYWSFPQGELQSCLIVDSLMLSNQLDGRTKAVITSIDKKGLMALEMREGDSLLSHLKVNLYPKGYRHLTPGNLNRYLNTAVAYEPTASVDSLLKLGMLLEKGDKEVARQILQQWITNNYFVIQDGRAMELLGIYLSVKPDIRLKKMKAYITIFDDLKVYLEADDDVRGIAKKTGLKQRVLRKCTPDQILMLRFLGDCSQCETDEQRMLFPILINAIVMLDL